MGTTIEKIADGEDYHLKFAKTNVYKRSYGNDKEELLFSYTITDDVTSILKDMNITGMSTVFGFGSMDLFQKHEIFDVNGNDNHIALDSFDFNYEENKANGTEFATAQLNGEPIYLSIVKVKSEYKAQLSIAHPDFSFRIEMLEPSDWCFEKS